MLAFYAEDLLAPYRTYFEGTTPFQLFASRYSAYSLLFSMSRNLLNSQTEIAPCNMGPEAKRTLARSRTRRKDSISIYLAVYGGWVWT